MSDVWMGFAASLAASIASIILYGIVVFETGQYINKYGIGPLTSFIANVFLVIIHTFPNTITSITLAGLPITVPLSVLLLVFLAVLPIKGFVSVSRVVSHYVGLARKIRDGYNVALNELEAISNESSEIAEKASTIEEKIHRVLEEGETVLGYRW